MHDPDDIIEIAGNTIRDALEGDPPLKITSRKLGEIVFNAIAPLIEADALEKAAKVAEKHTNWPAIVPETWAREEIAAAIRALTKN